MHSPADAQGVRFALGKRLSRDGSIDDSRNRDLRSRGPWQPTFYRQSTAIAKRWLKQFMKLDTVEGLDLA